MKRTTANADTHDEIISYQQLRTFIGLTGVLLPVAVVLGCYIFGAGNYSWQPSISHFYYSKMHIVFVCTLCVLGGFLINYRGKAVNPWENRVSNIAGFCAFAIASFPTQFDGFRPGKGGTNQYLELLASVNNFWGGMHFAFAGALFVCFIIFCLCFFQKPDKPYIEPTQQKKFRRRQRIYKFCGWGIAVSIVMIAVFSFGIKHKNGLLCFSTFIFETTSLWFFGTAWLIKGSEIWKDIPVLKKMIAPLR
ncbi:MAG TPA: hypothetical protein VMT76_14900 [Puia sp.]|nr:hypothetical protein [Puia sp.]